MAELTNGRFVEPMNAQIDTRRRDVRTGVLKRAKIAFGRTVIDCVVLDISTGGARVQWAMGTELGFAFASLAPLAEDAASLALSAFNALPTNDLDIPIRLLRSVRFFDAPVLAKATKAAEAAYAHFKTTPKERIHFRV